MSPLILIYVLLLILVVGGLFVGTMIYRARERRRDTDTVGIPRATRPRTGDQPPQPPR